MIAALRAWLSRRLLVMHIRNLDYDLSELTTQILHDRYAKKIIENKLAIASQRLQMMVQSDISKDARRHKEAA